MNALRTSEAGLALIRAAEGLRLTAYRDTGGIWTIGYGHTKGVRAGQSITREQAEQFLHDDAIIAEDTIRDHLPGAVIEAMPQAAWDALVSFAFNLGANAFRNPRNNSSTGLLRALVAREWSAVPAQMRRWVYDNGRKLKGLIARREAEATLWQSGFGEATT